jgi:hypothetical protein
LALNSGIQTNQILTNDDEVCIPSLSSILLAVLCIFFKSKSLGISEKVQKRGNCAKCDERISKKIDFHKVRAKEGCNRLGDLQWTQPR